MIATLAIAAGFLLSPPDTVSTDVLLEDVGSLLEIDMIVTPSDTIIAAYWARDPDPDRPFSTLLNEARFGPMWLFQVQERRGRIGAEQLLWDRPASDPAFARLVAQSISDNAGWVPVAMT